MKLQTLHSQFKSEYSWFKFDEIKKRDEWALAQIINTLDADLLLNLCLLHFILICSFQNTEMKENFVAINVAMKMGRKCILKFLFSLKKNSIGSKKYSLWYDEYKSHNHEFVSFLEDDKFIAKLGFLLVQILETTGMISKNLVFESKTVSFYSLSVDDHLLEMKERLVFDLPLKLPMIVKPKKYDEDNLGGYLLNDVKYKDDLIVHKNFIKNKSFISKNNIIYNMVNKISGVAFKINV